MAEWDKAPEAGEWMKAPAAEMSWGDAALKSVTNIPESAGKFASDLVQPILHPIDTAKALGSVVKGGFDATVRRKITPEALDAARLKEFFVNRYGSEESLKKTLAEDPVGLAADLSTILSGGSMAAARAPGSVAAATSRALNTAARVTDPVNVAVQGTKAAGNAAGKVVPDIIGNLGTHTGGDSIREAARAGYEGGKSGDAFLDNMRGNVPIENILEKARAGLSAMREERGNKYRSGMAAISNDKTVLDLTPIETAINAADSVKQYKGQDLSASTAGTRKEIKDAFNEWKALDPAEYHTPEGLDAFKQKIGDIRESSAFGSPARKVADEAYNAIKKEITKQAPTYAKVMKEYEQASDQLREIERALSLGKKSSVDSGIRKLQSVLRNNVNTNFGNRRDLVKALDDAGADDLMASIAGQSANSWTPRGLGTIGANTAVTGALALANPAVLATLPFQSPRLMGEAAYYGGKGAGAVNAGVSKIPASYRATLEKILGSRPGRLGAFQAGRIEEEAQ